MGYQFVMEIHYFSPNPDLGLQKTCLEFLTITLNWYMLSTSL